LLKVSDENIRENLFQILADFDTGLLACGSIRKSTPLADPVSSPSLPNSCAINIIGCLGKNDQFEMNIYIFQQRLIIPLADVLFP
jgi:hypothetical protein